MYITNITKIIHENAYLKGCWELPLWSRICDSGNRRRIEFVEPNVSHCIKVSNFYFVINSQLLVLTHLQNTIINKWSLLICESGLNLNYRFKKHTHRSGKGLSFKQCSCVQCNGFISLSRSEFATSFLQRIFWFWYPCYH